MSQPHTVTRRGSQLAYPTWAAHTTTCPALLAHGAGRRVCAIDGRDGCGELRRHWGAGFGPNSCGLTSVIAAAPRFVTKNVGSK
jgi:hypothetical protein